VDFKKKISCVSFCLLLILSVIGCKVEDQSFNGDFSDYAEQQQGSADADDNESSVQEQPVVTEPAKLMLPGQTDLKINKNEEGGFYLTLNGEPFIIKGIIYNPTPIGKGYTYDFYSDPAKPWMIDGILMKEAGVNCVRVYSAGSDLQKVREFVHDMYENFGIYTIVSDWLGLWALPSANYADIEFQNRIKDNVVNVVRTLKDEPGVLMWILGNENNYTFSGKIGFWTSPEIEQIESLRDRILKKAEIYYTFVNDVAKEIKKIDNRHLISLSNGETSYLDIASNVCTDIDTLSIISYRGKKFGNLFRNVKSSFDKPVFLSEFGADSYDAFEGKPSQEHQIEYLQAQWDDIKENMVSDTNFSGNCIGGIVFEWTDEWWKHDHNFQEGWSIHNTEGGWSEGAYYFDIRVDGNMNMNEEWFGIMELSPEIDANGINTRVPKLSYYKLRQMYTGQPMPEIVKENDLPGMTEHMDEAVFE
jgi:hypothetical protein